MEEEKLSEITTVAESIVVEHQADTQPIKVEPQLTQENEYKGQESQNLHKSHQEEHVKIEQNLDDYDPAAFQKFNDPEPEAPPKVQEKILVEQKPVKNSTQQKPAEQPAKKVESVKQAKEVKLPQKPAKIEQKPVPVEKKPETAPQKQLSSQKPEKQIKKKSKKKKAEESEPLPVISADSEEGKKQVDIEKKKQQIKKQVESGNSEPPSGSPAQNNKKPQPSEKIIRQQASQIKEPEMSEVSSIIIPSGVGISAGEIIFQAQRQRIGSTLDLFFKYTAKHQKHTTNQKQLITNIEDEIEKRRLSKTSLMNTLKDYFDNFVSLCRDLYERSYKFAKSDKQMSANPMINMREELKGGIDEMIFLRKATGNEYNRLGEFIGVNVSKNVVKLFTDYWKAIGLAQTKQKEKKQEFARKEKQFAKRINKVIKVYTKGKQGSSQQEDLFIEMIKFINQEKQYRNCLIEYGIGLVPLKKAFIKAEQVLYEQLQLLFNTYKNQFRCLFSIHPKQFTQIQKMEKLIKDNTTFEKLSDITDGDYVRSVLITLEKGSVQTLTDKEFEKVLNMLHFEEIVGNSVELLKGTTTKTFELKNKAEQVVDTVSGNLLIFNRESAQMKEKFIIKNIDARIVQQGVVQIDQTLKGIIFDSHRTVRITFRDNDRADELICFLNQVHENIKQQELANSNKK